jgi:glycosyltransferase involved in cell wall biosynthesis
LRGTVYEILRSLARNLASLDPFVQLTARRAALGLATTSETEQRMRALGCRTVEVLSHAALAEDEIGRLRSVGARQARAFRVVSVGDLLHLKGFELGLRAFAQFCAQVPSSEYWLIGDGPERERLERLAQRLGVAPKVTFWGRQPRSQALEKLADCDVLLHPTLHDSSGWASVEAMASGRAVICLDLGGTALQVTEDTGVKVHALSPRQAMHDLAAALYQLASDPLLCRRLGDAGRRRVDEHFNWERKGRKMAEIYTEMTQNGDTAPEALGLT